jgi:hypothetical protein
MEIAMDISHFSDKSTVDYSDGNEDVEDSVEQIIDNLKELLYMLKSGKKIEPQLKSNIYKSLDSLNNTHSQIKYKN